MNSSIQIVENDPTAQERAKQAAAQTENQGSDSPFNKGCDPLVLAFFFLLDASTVSSESAMIRAKQLNQNALTQQRLNNKAAELQWYNVPKEQVNHHAATVLAQTHWTWEFWLHSGQFEYTTFKNIPAWDSYPNGSIVNNIQTKNRQVAAQRDLFANKLTLMQQQAGIAAGGINSISGEAMQSMQEGGNLLQILQSLTFQALLRHPVQG